VHLLEFTIEPFVEGNPGPHVRAAIEAVGALGVEVEVGPFGTSCTAGTDVIASLVAEVTRAALEHGATHVSLHVTAAGDES
jgi:uncharacterized protein YqgV (UPF0045/DUF77 family)